MQEEVGLPEVQAEQEPYEAAEVLEWRCDRCGSPMVERNCKVVCPNCGSRFDCSDLTLYFD